MTSRRFLVVVRAGEKSLHAKWLQGGHRNWDLVVSWYGDTTYRTTDDEAVIEVKGGAGDGIYNTFQRLPDLIDRYDYFWLPDDDIDADCETINRLFEIASQEDLPLCQPALTHDSYFSWVHTLVSPSFKLRYTTFVEIMVPCLSRMRLKAVLPCFKDNPSAYGVDKIWSRLEEDNRYRAAIIDEVLVRHTRPVGGFLRQRVIDSGQDPREAKQRIRSPFGSKRAAGFNCYAGVLRSGRLCGPLATRLVMAWDYCRHASLWRQEFAWRRMRREFRQPAAALSQLTDLNGLRDGVSVQPSVEKEEASHQRPAGRMHSA